MRIYLSGAITSLDHAEAEAAFLAAETLIEKAGHTPLNPMKLVDQGKERCWEDYMIEDIEIVLYSSEALYMLANWRRSKGATVEHAIAGVLGRPIFYAASELPVGSDWPEPEL